MREWSMGGKMIYRAKLKCSEKILPQCHFFTINPTLTALGLNLGICTVAEGSN
jgi:hypothetical protein